MKDADLPTLHDLFYSRGVAVVGASSNPAKPGYKIIENMVTQGYNYGIFPVNPRLESVLGLRCYRSVLDIDDNVDLVVFVVPAPEVLRIVEEELSARKRTRGDVKGVVVIGGGFKEMGEEGAAKELHMKGELRSLGIRLIGPNCQGLINTETGLNTTFDMNIKPRRGGVSVITQSGALGNGILRMAATRGHFGIDKFISFGNMGDVDAAEAIDYLSGLQTTRVIAAYIEDVPDGRAFYESMRRAAGRKPVVILKPGRTRLGAQAALSHTGALAGEDLIWDAAIRQAGALRAYTLKEFYDAVRVLEKLPPLRGPNIAVLTVVGGPGTLCVDRIHSSRCLRMARLSDVSKERLRRILAPVANVGRPEGYVDMTGSVTEELHYEALKIVLEDGGVDGVIFLEEPPTYLSERWASEVVRAYSEQDPARAKPVVATVVAGDAVYDHIRILEEGGIPVFEHPEAAVDAIDKAAEYHLRTSCGGKRAAGGDLRHQIHAISRRSARASRAGG